MGAQREPSENSPAFIDSRTGDGNQAMRWKDPSRQVSTERENTGRPQKLKSGLGHPPP